MHALIFATGYSTEMALLSEYYPTALLPLVDRPFLQHIVEILVEQGIRHFDFVLSHLPEQIEQHFGNGTRWGSTFRYHLTRHALHPYASHTLLGMDSTTPLLIGHADTLPPLHTVHDMPHDASHTPTLFAWQPGLPHHTSWEWSGWGWLTPAQLAHLPQPCDFRMATEYVMTLAQQDGKVIEITKPLRMQSYTDFMASHRQVLTKAASGLLLSGREVEEGIWLSQNVSLHPTAHLTSPVYVSTNCSIGADTQLGPHAVVGNDCIIDNGSHLAHTVIFPGSYVGQNLDLTHVIVDQSSLIDPASNTTVPVTDASLLASVSMTSMRRWLTQSMARILALFLLLGCTPFILLTMLWLKLTRQGPVCFGTDVVRLPTTTLDITWRTFRLWRFAPTSHDEDSTMPSCGSLRHFVLVFLPSLVSIVQGRLHFVGVPPRTVEEVKALPPYWQQLYVQSKLGIISEAEVYYGSHTTADEQYLAEAFYSVHAGFWHDLRLFLRYLGRLLHLTSPLSTRPPSPQVHDRIDSSTRHNGYVDKG